ncbi:cilia- and flagella-associated protein 65 isoform 2-T2 [Synchiropus picturatus]
MLAEGRHHDLSDTCSSWKQSTSKQDLSSERCCGRVASQRSFPLGLDVKLELVWEDWDLGKDFTKTLVVKNVHRKLQRLQLRPPESKFFTVSTPSWITLSTGTSCSVPITFRPIQRCEYEDSIELQNKEDALVVRLRAIIPQPAVDVPRSVWLPLCAVQESSSATFLLRNTSKLCTQFQWECPAPFRLCPQQGALKPGQRCEISVQFQPQQALVHQQQACCRFGREGGKRFTNSCSVLLQGLAKYPCLLLQLPAGGSRGEGALPVLDFGLVPAGQRVQQSFTLMNPSPVTATLTLSRLPGGPPLLGTEFTCNVMKGTVAAGEAQSITVTFAPVVADTVSVENVVIRCRGALNNTVLQLTGQCIGPAVSISTTVVNFGRVKLGQTGSQQVELLNSSSVEALFSWDLDCCGHSVFSIQPPCGAVPPRGRTLLRVCYKPTQPIVHYRRVTCFLLYREALELDIMGTCHSELHQPAVLKPEHLVLYSIQQHKKLCPARRKKQPELSGAADSSPEKSSPSGWSPEVSGTPSELLFNHQPSPASPRSAASQAVSITNHTRVTLSLVWTIAADSPFSVHPATGELAPLKSTSFRVKYQPKQLNTLHGGQLECYAFEKQEFDHVKERLLSPPRYFILRVIGHSFQPGKEHFVPKCSLDPAQVMFAGLGYSTHSVLLRNFSDLPLTYSWSCLLSSEPSLASAVTVLPSCGWIRPGGLHILTLGTTPTEACPKQGFHMTLQLNSSQVHQKVLVVSTVEKPAVEAESCLYFKPTMLGSTSQRAHHIRNTCRFPLRFQWSVPETDQEVFLVQPETGELQPNQSLAQAWTFSPQAEETYTAKPSLSFWPVQTPGSNKSQMSLSVVGVGAVGLLTAERAVVDVAETLVGSYRSIEIPLVNRSLCPVTFSLCVSQILPDEQPAKPEPKALLLDCTSRTVASHTTLVVQATFRPHKQAQFLWTISYQTLNTSGQASSPPRMACEVRAEGVYATLQVIDARGGGSAGRFSRGQLWKLLLLDDFNDKLVSSSTALSGPTSPQSRTSCATIVNRTMLDFKFVAAPVNSDPSTFVLKFYNPGCIPVDWSFLLPEDQHIELEYWAETGEFSDSELHQMKAESNHLFNISPRSGVLQPGQQSAVQFSYRHQFVGTNHLPITFKLSHDKEIWLNFLGLTLENNRPFLQFNTKHHVFTAVAVSELMPPLQVYEIYNAGAVPVQYEVDQASLSQLQEDNFNHPVLSCLNPRGQILPGALASLEFIFSPFELKTYLMDIPIHVEGGDSTTVRFEGQGLHTPVQASTNQFLYKDVPRIPFPEEVVFLSENVLALGDVTVGSQTSNIIFLTNRSDKESVHFVWDLSQQGSHQVVQIYPEEGSLSPGECVPTFLTITFTQYPTIYQIDILCKLTSEAALTEYYTACQRWKREAERKQFEFTITDKDLVEKPRDVEGRPQPPGKGPALRRYKALPPIAPSTGDAAACCSIVAERKLLRRHVEVQKQPEGPKSLLLHLAVTATSHKPPPEAHTPDHLHKMHYQILDAGSPDVWDELAHVPDIDVLSHVLTTILRDVVEEEDFAESLISLKSRSDVLRPEASDHALLSSFAPQPSAQSVESPEKPLGPVDMVENAIARTVPEVPLDICEDILMNTIQNLLTEAARGDFELTSEPLTVFLPPFSCR